MLMKTQDGKSIGLHSCAYMRIIRQDTGIILIECKHMSETNNSLEKAQISGFPPLSFEVLFCLLDPGETTYSEIIKISRQEYLIVNTLLLEDIDLKGNKLNLVYKIEDLTTEQSICFSSKKDLMYYVSRLLRSKTKLLGFDVWAKVMQVEM